MLLCLNSCFLAELFDLNLLKSPSLLCVLLLSLSTNLSSLGNCLFVDDSSSWILVWELAKCCGRIWGCDFLFWTSPFWVNIANWGCESWLMCGVDRKAPRSHTGVLRPFVFKVEHTLVLQWPVVGWLVFPLNCASFWCQSVVCNCSVLWAIANWLNLRGFSLHFNLNFKSCR
jgi:hypothetical protein